MWRLARSLARLLTSQPASQPVNFLVGKVTEVPRSSLPALLMQLDSWLGYVIPGFDFVLQICSQGSQNDPFDPRGRNKDPWRSELACFRGFSVLCNRRIHAKSRCSRQGRWREFDVGGVGAGDPLLGGKL